METIKDIINKDIMEDFKEEVQQERQEAQQNSGIDLSFLKCETGSGSVEDYKEHALNFDGSMAMARILRGLSGFLGNLNYALADIVVGILEYAKQKNKPDQDIDSSMAMARIVRGNPYE
jgi:hypothetical protein